MVAGTQLQSCACVYRWVISALAVVTLKSNDKCVV